VSDTLALMHSFVGPPSPESLRRVSGFDRAQLGDALSELAVDPDARRELEAHWDETRESTRWAPLLAALSDYVRRERASVDAPIPIWDDLDDLGTEGRLLYYYLFALELETLKAHYDLVGVPPDVRRATLAALASHGKTHLLKHASAGVDAGWWMLLILRGVLIQVESLKFHALHLGVGVLSPQPWLAQDEAARRGEGFRVGDAHLGVHIPARADLSDEALDRTFARAREVVAQVWPVPTRRIATCQSWMMDDRLVQALGEESRIVRFQRRFELLEPYADDVENVLYFVFGVRDVDPAQLQPRSRLQRFIKEVLVAGGAWHSRIGWLDMS